MANGGRLEAVDVTDLSWQWQQLFEQLENQFQGGATPTHQEKGKALNDE